MQDDRLVVAERAETSLSREQKAGLFFVILCGLGALVFGAQFVWTHMAKPFAVDYTGPRLVTGAEKQSAEITAQKSTDTDGDTVSDYDELYIFKTSPYLSDSDSDGLTDGSEIAAGQDPNCAVGDNCVSNADTIMPSGPADFVQGQAGTAADEAARLQQGLDTLNNLPPDQIRDLLINAGADADSVNALSDDDLQSLYQDLLSQLQDSGALTDITNQVLTPTQ